MKEELEKEEVKEVLRGSEGEGRAREGGEGRAREEGGGEGRAMEGPINILTRPQQQSNMQCLIVSSDTHTNKENNKTQLLQTDRHRTVRRNFLKR